jgi:hypothetical protein
LKTAGVKTCSTYGGPGGGKLEKQLNGTAGGHIATSCGHVSLHMSAR